MKVNLQVLRNQYLEDEEEIQEINIMIYNAELAENKFKMRERKCSMKANLELEACKVVQKTNFLVS